MDIKQWLQQSPLPEEVFFLDELDNEFVEMHNDILLEYNNSK